MNTGRRLTAIALLAGFVVIVVTAASAQPLEAENVAASRAATRASGPVRHFVGTATEVGASSLTVNSGGTNLVVATSDQTVFISFLSGTRTTSGLAAIKVGDRIAALGAVSGSTMDAKLVALVPSHQTKRHADHGTVTAVTAKTVSFTSTAAKNSAGVFGYTKDTVFTAKVGGKITKVAATTLQVGDRVSFVGSVDSSGIITAKLVHIIPH